MTSLVARRSAHRALGGHALRRGISLVEVVLAAMIFAGIGYVLVLTLQASERSHETVVSNAASNADLRENTTTLRDELRGAQPTSIVHEQVNGYSRLTFTTAIDGPAGATTWGAFDRRIAVNEDDCHQAGWQIRYEVAAQQDGSQALERQILDGAGRIQLEDTLVGDIEQFEITDEGDVWVVALVTNGEEGRREDEFDIRTRTQ